ncbi:hypothetical protein [Paenibacillus sp. PDC88]|uniref:hypothetical protein n=1 Tax=Paenibacillus sp. PDC88 TaxID=1884375 RepID=UPI000B8A5369|nr:hypothetical protein [Paenibacillus sp. PDC88]
MQKLLLISRLGFVLYVEEGVIKEGDVFWISERGNAGEIEWVKMKWYVTEGDGFDMDNEREEYSVKLQLK